MLNPDTEKPVDLVFIRGLVSANSTFFSFVKRVERASEIRKQRHDDEDDEENSVENDNGDHHNVPNLQQNRTNVSGTDSPGAAGKTPGLVEMVFSSNRVVFLDVGPFLLIAQAPESRSSRHVQQVVMDVDTVVKFYLGKFAFVTQDTSLIEGVLVRRRAGDGDGGGRGYAMARRRLWAWG